MVLLVHLSGEWIIVTGFVVAAKLKKWWDGKMPQTFYSVLGCFWGVLCWFWVFSCGFGCSHLVLGVPSWFWVFLFGFECDDDGLVRVRGWVRVRDWVRVKGLVRYQ